MTLLAPILFNLIANTFASFLAPLLLVILLIRGLRIGPGRGRLVLLLLPIVKVVWDLVRGIPRNSFLWTHLGGAEQDLGSFFFGVGMEAGRPPTLRLMLGALSDDVLYPQSAGDLLYRGLSKHISPLLPLAAVLVVLGVMAFRLGVRFWGLTRFALQTRRVLDGAVTLGTQRVGRRRITIYASPLYEGVPFAPLTLHPCVIFSTKGFSALGDREREAVILHEVSHVIRRDPFVIVVLQFASDLLWFLPGLRRLLRRVFADLELLADVRAVNLGASPEFLARALISIGESALIPESPSAGLFRQRPLLTERVQQLLDPSPAVPRLFYRHWLGRAFVFFGIVPSVLFSVFLGNGPS